MEPFEASVDDELFRISERIQPDGSPSYDFIWLNGPADGTYGFTIGITVAQEEDGEQSELLPPSEEQLTTYLKGFLRSFYEEGGIGQTDFPDHVPARAR